MNVLLYLAIFKKYIVNESIQSIKSFYAVANQELIRDTKIVVYTDMPSLYSSMKHLIIEQVTDELYRDWIGPEEYIYRAKIKALQHCLNKYKLATLFVDADTMFIRSPEKIFKNINNQYYYLNYIENDMRYKVSSIDISNNEMTKYFYKTIYTTKYVVGETKEYPITGELINWNSGVIGISYENKQVLNEVLVLSDIIWKNYNLRIAEQFAFSYVFQNYQVISAEDTIFHYWFLKESRYLLEDFFGKSNYDEISPHMNDEIIKIIKSMRCYIKCYDAIFKSIVFLIDIKWGTANDFLNMDIHCEGFLRKIIFDSDFVAENKIELKKIFPDDIINISRLDHK